MRLAVTLPFEDITASESVAFVQRAESLGYDEAWSYERDFFDAFTPLAAAAAVTERIRLGTAIVPALTRPPGLIAMSAASVAHLAPGRFALGLGTSTEGVVSGWMGLEWSRPQRRTLEVVAAVRKLLDGERVGRLKLYRPPAGRVPIYVAALGARMTASAAEVADGVCLFMAGPQALPRVRELAGAGLDTVARVVTVTGQSRAEAMDFARRYIAMYAALPTYARFLSEQGFEEEVAAVGDRWRQGDRRAAAAQVSDAMVGDLVWVLADAGRQRLPERLADAGLGCLDLWFMSPASDAGQRRRDLEQALEVAGEAALAPPPVGA